MDFFAAADGVPCVTGRPSSPHPASIAGRAASGVCTSTSTEGVSMEPNPLFLSPVSPESEPVEAPSISEARDTANSTAPVYGQLFSEKS